MVVENLSRIWDMEMLNAEQRGISRGRTEGIAEGISRGISQGIRQVAMKMIKRKMSDKTIKSMTGISDEELEKIKEEVK